MSETNAHPGNETWTVDCDITDTVTLTSTISIGTSILDILKLIPNIEWKFDGDTKTLIVRRTIGIDRTTGTNFLEYRRDIVNPRNKNIIKATHALNADNISNAVNDNATSVETDTDSITEF